jgi:hypothetical protein
VAFAGDKALVKPAEGKQLMRRTGEAGNEVSEMLGDAARESGRRMLRKEAERYSRQGGNPDGPTEP